ncbi:MAG: Lactose transport system permease protein LacF [Actinomycetota bacterium]|jgi:raffinose/stachyose/melibiose transport system permease protein
MKTKNATTRSQGPEYGQKGAEPKLGSLSFRRKNRSLVTFGSWWWAAPALTAVFFVHYVATVYGASYSFTDFTGLGEANWVGFDNYVQLTQDPAVLGSIGNTFFLALLYFAAVTVIGLLLALALNRSLKTRYLLRVILFLPVVLSSLAVSYIFKFIFEADGALNRILIFFGLPGDTLWLADPKTAIWTILVVMIWQNIGISMVILLAGLATVPAELEEAAAIDGASIFDRFWHITFPLIQPAIAISTTLALISGLRVFDQVVAMTGGGPYGATETLSTVIYKYTFEYSNYGYGAALAVVFTLVLAAAAGIQLYITRDRSAKN